MADFDFTQLSNSSGPYSGFAAPAINDAGTAAFEGFFDLSAPPAAILNGSGEVGPTGPVNTVVSNYTPPLSFTFQPSINNAGTTSFAGAADFNGDFVPDFSGVFTSNNGQVTNLLDNSAGFTQFALTSINSPGTVAFYGTTFAGDSGIYSYSNGNLTTIASTAGEYSTFLAGFGGTTVGRGDGPFGVFSSTSINDSGTVAFTAGLDTGGNGIFTSNGNTTQTIAATGSNDFNFQTFGSASINNSGDVAFLAAFDDDADGTSSTGIFKYVNGEYKVLANSSGPFLSFASDPALNDKGQVAFLATTNDGVTGIFTGSDPLADKVIAIGDQIDGYTVTELFASSQGLNSQGEIAFTAVVADASGATTRQILRAEPALKAGGNAEPVPEAGTSMAAVFAVAIFLFLGRRWRTRKLSSFAFEERK